MSLKIFDDWKPLASAKFVLFGALLAGIYYSTYSWLIQHDWSREDYNYCYMIPLVVLYLIWEKKNELAAEPAAPSWGGLLFLIPGILLFWVGELAGEAYSIYISSWLLGVGLLCLNIGWRKLKVIAFALFMILTMFPPPHFLNTKLTFGLKLISSQLGVMLLHLYGMSAYREGNVIDLGFTQLQVVDACSGLRYLFPLLIMGILLAYFYRAALWKRLVLVLSTIPLTIGVNSLRIALTGVIYANFGAAAAEGFFHGFSGWLIFIVSLFILVAEMKVLCFRQKAFGKDGWFAIMQTTESKMQTSETKQKPPDIRLQTSDMTEETPALRPQIGDLKLQKSDSGPQRADFIPQTSDSKVQAADSKLRNEKFTLKAFFSPCQFVVAIILLTLTLAISQGVEFREKTPASKPFEQFPVSVGGWEGTRRYMGQEFIKELDLSDYTMIDFKSGGKHVDFYIAYYESQRKGESIHSPETCLPGSGWEFKQAGKAQIALRDPRGVMTVNRAIMEKGGYRQLSYFWFPARGRILTNAWEMKIYTFWDALTRQRTDGALVRLITPVLQGERVEDAEKRLEEFTGLILPVLDQFLPK